MMMDNAASIKEQELRNQADALIVTVKESYLNGTGIHEIEKSLFEALLKMGHQALGLLFDLCGSGDVGQSVCLDNGREVNRLAVPHVKLLMAI
jgi:hypothetical protein